MELQQEWYLQEARNAEDGKRHRPMSEENAFWHAVATGDLDFVRQNCREKKFTETEGVGVLSRDAVTNLKYHFVITTAMITRLCVEAGMEMEQAFRLSDFYILKLDNIHSIQAVVDLHDQMVLDFTGMTPKKYRDRHMHRTPAAAGRSASSGDGQGGDQDISNSISDRSDSIASGI